MDYDGDIEALVDQGMQRYQNALAILNARIVEVQAGNTHSLFYDNRPVMMGLSLLSAEYVAASENVRDIYVDFCPNQDTIETLINALAQNTDVLAPSLAHAVILLDDKRFGVELNWN